MSWGDSASIGLSSEKSSKLALPAPPPPPEPTLPVFLTPIRTLNNGLVSSGLPSPSIVEPAHDLRSRRPSATSRRPGRSLRPLRSLGTFESLRSLHAGHPRHTLGPAGATRTLGPRDVPDDELLERPARLAGLHDAGVARVLLDAGVDRVGGVRGRDRKARDEQRSAAQNGSFRREDIEPSFMSDSLLTPAPEGRLGRGTLVAE